MATHTTPSDLRRSAPAVQRNREPILDVLKQFFPTSGTVLELASGTGEHAVYFCEHFERLKWQPSDVDPNNLNSIEAWRAQSNLANLLAPLTIDLSHPSTASAPFYSAPFYSAAFCANLIHIAPWNVCQNLMRFVGSALWPAARFVMYGPYKIDGRHTAPSNEAFEQWLWSQNTDYGVRDVNDVVTEAMHHHLALLERVPMPANNFCLVFEKQSVS